MKIYVTFLCPLSFFRSMLFVLFGIAIGVAGLLGQNAVAQTNIELLSHLPYDQQLSNIWGYAENGREYAIVGLYNGTSIVDVTNKSDIQPLFHIEGVPSIWREIKTWQHYAYVVSESGGGLQIVDLQYLPDSIKTYDWHGGFFGGADSLHLNKAHTNFVDENGILYLNGTNLDAVLMCNVAANPTDPPIVGLYEGGYVHDLFVRNDTMWTGEIYNGYFGVVDVSDKANPVIMATQATPNAFTHNTWLTDNGRYLFTTDEKTGAFVTCYDVSDISDIKETDRYRSSPNTGVIPHNTYVVHRNGQTFVVTSYYNDGVTIVDANDPYNLVETGHYDTSPLSGSGFHGAWGVYPYLPSGALLVSDMEEGLFVLNPTYTQAAYFQGVVSSDEGAVLSGVSVSIEGHSNYNTTTAFDGSFSTGIPQNGTYNVTFYLYGYLPLTIPVTFENGQITTQDVVLQTIVPFTLSVNVTDENGVPLVGVGVGIFDDSYDVELYAMTNDEGMAQVTLYYPDTYEILAGKWGYVTAQHIALPDNLDEIQTLVLYTGYYDDFTFQNDWQVSGTATVGQWERATPHNVLFLGNQVNPDGDLSNDYGRQCYITGAEGNISDNVGDGFTLLTSPVFDLSTYQNPILSYYRWVYFQDNSNGIGGNDTLYVWIDNGLTSVLLEQVYNGNIYESQWRKRSYLVNDYLTPTTNMRLILSVSDKFISPHVVKAGLDLFSVAEGTLPEPVMGVLDAYVCVGEPVVLSNLSEGDYEQVTWILSGSTTSISSANNPVVTYNAPGDYNVSLILSNLIGSSTLNQTAYIHVGVPPSGLALNDFNNEICLGNAAQLSAECADALAVLTWQGNGIEGELVGNMVEIVPSTAGEQVYTLSATNDYCAVAQDFSLFVQPLPSVSITGNTAYCNGQTLQLTAQGDSSATSYTWQTEAGVVLGNMAAISYNNLPANDSTFALIATLSNALGCTNSDTVSVQITNPDLTSGLTLLVAGMQHSVDEPYCIQYFYTTPNFEAIDNSGQVVGYEWQGPYLLGDTHTASVMVDVDSLLFYSQQGLTNTYSLILTNAEGCTNSLSFDVSAVICYGINDATTAQYPIQVYPNPTSGNLYIAANDWLKGEVISNVFNSLGQMVGSETLFLSNQTPTLLQLEKLLPGMYHVQIIGAQHTAWVNVLKE